MTGLKRASLKCFLILAAAMSCTSAVAQSSQLFQRSQEARGVADFGGDPYQISAVIVPAETADQWFLVVRVVLNNGHYIYSLTQAEGMATRLEVALPASLLLAGPFRSSQPPKTVERDPILQMKLEKHFGEIEFYLPLRQNLDIPERPLEIPVRINGQVCSEHGSCHLIRDKIVRATLSGDSGAKPIDGTAR